MKYLISLITAYCFIAINFAQSPGYLGKKISIESDINLLPRFTELMMFSGQEREVISYRKSSYEPDVYYYQLERVDNKSYKPIKFNLKSSLSINYTLSKKVELSIRANYIKARFIFRNHDGNSKYDITSISETVSYKAYEIDLNIKIYRKNFIAPVGKYIMLGIGRSRASTINNNFNVEYLYYSSQISSSIFGKQTIDDKATFIKFNIGIGEKKVFKNNLYFKYELESNFYSLGKYNASILGANSGNKNIEQALGNIFAYNVGRNLAFDNLLSLKLGFGIIF